MPSVRARFSALAGALSLLPVVVAPSAAQVTTLDSLGDVGGSAAVAIGSDGLGLISYRDATNQTLKVAHCSNPACTAATITTLDTGLVSTATAVTVGGDGLGLIVYEVGGFPPAGSMKVAHCSDLACTSANIQILGGGYTPTDIVTGPDGFGLMSYVVSVSPARAASVIRHCLDPLCSAADSSPALRASVGLAMGADGLGLYVYTVPGYFPLPGRVEVYHCSDASCSAGTTSLLETGPASGTQPSSGDLAVGGDGLGLFVLQRFDGDFMAHCTDTVCSSITRAPATTGDSIATGPDGLAVMSHSSGGILRFSHCDDALCAAQTLSTPIDTGAGSASLRVGPDGLALLAYQGGSADLRVAHCSLTSCLAPGPKLSISDAAAAEGDAGTMGADMLVTLSEASASPVSVDWQTDTSGGATATPGVDFIAASGTLSFAPGELSQAVTVQVAGDTAAEPDEFLFVRLSSASGAPIQDDSGRLTIVDDDAPSLSFDELVHGAEQRHDLQAQPGPVADRDFFRLGQGPWSSWEVVVDETSGDVPPLILERLAADGTTVLQTGAAAAGGASVSMRWSNDGGFPVLNQHLGVSSGGCGPTCGPSAVYRIRAYETTGAIARFNNSATQLTIVTLENVSSTPVHGTLWFAGGGGALLASQAFDLAPRVSYVFDTRGIALLVGASGSIRVTHDGRYGDVAGKAVALEPATGFTFDTALTYRPR